MTEQENFLDEDIVLNLKELGNGDGEFANRLLIVQLISLYIENLPERMSELTNGINEKNPRLIELAAHSLKSSSQLIGLTSLAADCQILEEMGFSKKLENSDAVFTKIESTTRKIVKVLKNKIIELEKNSKSN